MILSAKYSTQRDTYVFCTYLILRNRTEHAIYKYTATRQTMVSRTLAVLRIPLIFHCVNRLGLYPFFNYDVGLLTAAV